jgi:ATP-dependent Clp protease ATP-binding subunit ClpA
VEQARFAGRSWAAIGAVLGISRQAAQQRFFRPFAIYETERFSEELHRAMTAIKQEAVERRHNYIGTEHVLLGLLAEPNTATAVLEFTGTDPSRVRLAVARELSLGASQAAQRIPWTPYARKILTLAAESAGGNGGDRIECRHVLTAILRLGRGRAADALAGAGISEAAVEPRPARRH